MATKQRNIQLHTVKFADGKTLEVKNYYTYTRNGVCETSIAHFEWQDENGEWHTQGEYKGRYSWYNRPWQSFDYESAMKGMIAKLPKQYQEHATAVLIERTASEEEAEAEMMLKDFTEAHDALSDRGKEIFSNAFVNSKEEAEALTRLMKMAALMGL